MCSNSLGSSSWLQRGRNNRARSQALLQIGEFASIKDTGGSHFPRPPGGSTETKQAAERLAVSTDTVYDLCESGKLRHHEVTPSPEAGEQCGSTPPWPRRRANRAGRYSRH